jgi:hypothetical protein
MCNVHDYRLGLVLSSSKTSSMSHASTAQIRKSVVEQMHVVYWFHVRISLLLMCIQTLFIGEMTSSVSVSLFAFAVMLNLVCLAERFWDLQLRSLVYWPPACQCVFLVSRLALVSVAIICTALWARVAWVSFWCGARGRWQ